MTISLRALLLILGGTLLTIGLALGFTPITYDGGPCGTAFTGRGDAQYREEFTRTLAGPGPSYEGFAEGCADARSGRFPLALGLSLPGAAMLLASILVPGKPLDASHKTDLA